jgi:hypothetical protein
MSLQIETVTGQMACFYMVSLFSFCSPVKRKDLLRGTLRKLGEARKVLGAVNEYLSVGYNWCGRYMV